MGPNSERSASTKNSDSVMTMLCAHFQNGIGLRPWKSPGILAAPSPPCDVLSRKARINRPAVHESMKQASRSASTRRLDRAQEDVASTENIAAGSEGAGGRREQAALQPLQRSAARRSLQSALSIGSLWRSEHCSIVALRALDHCGAPCFPLSWATTRGPAAGGRRPR